jgi:type IV pilus assembly protein PilE
MQRGLHRILPRPFVFLKSQLRRKAVGQTRTHSCQRTSRAFTLVETVIVVVILAILISLAYPSYVEQVRKARRADAESALLGSAQLLERCFTRLNAYNADGCPDPVGSSDSGYYTISIVRDATTYTLTATPEGDQANDPCGNFTLDHLGNKTPIPDSNRCWGPS